MKIKISSHLLKYFPGIQYTVILLRNVNNSRKASSISQLLRGAAAVAKNELKKADKKSLFAQVAELETEDGQTFLESYLLAGRFKKIHGGKDLEGKNNLLNFTAFISLKFFLPLHGLDLDTLDSDAALDLYKPRKGKKSPELEFTSETRNLVLFFPNLAKWDEEKMDYFIDEIDANLKKYLQTSAVEIYYLDAEKPEVDLGYESEAERLKKEALAQENPLVPLVRAEDSTELVMETAIEQNEESNDASEPILETPETMSEDVEAGLEQEEVKPSEARQEETAHPSQRIAQLIAAVLGNDFPELASLDDQKDFLSMVEVEVPRDSSHGDFSTNIAMKLARDLGRSPREVADQIVNSLRAKEADWLDLLANIEVLGPGFINFRLAPAWLEKNLLHILTTADYGQQAIGQKQKIMVEFGSLNIAKPFGAHHFLTTVIGQTLVNLYRALDYDVLAADHPGDWGTQFGKSLYAYKHWGDQDTVEKDPMNELLKLYVRFHQEAEQNPALEDAAREEFRKLENGDSENRDIWEWMVKISMADLEQIYQTMGVKHDRRYGEAKYNQACQDLLERGKKLGVFTEGEKGAYIADLEAGGLPPALVQKGDGTSLYITRDLASIEDRLGSEKDLQEIIYIVDAAQTLHFKQLFAVAGRLHEADSSYPVCQFRHVPYGRMNFADGGMSTRQGNVILGVDLIREATKRATQIMEEKLAVSEEKFSALEKQQLSRGLALGAIKYAMLSQAPESDFTFDWDKVLSFEGNSAPYLQYTLARAQSILRKQQATNHGAGRAAKKPVAIDQTSLFSLEEEQQNDQELAEIAAAEAEASIFGLPAEQALLHMLPQFPERVATAALKFKPNMLTTYLHELAQAFNSFYGAVPVLKTQRPDLLESRLNLVKATVRVLKNGLKLLDIANFERM